MKASTPIQARKIRTPKARNLPGFLAFGDNNLFPQQLDEVIGESPTASSCLDAKARFIEGNGFNDKAFWKMKVHRSGLTMDRVLSKTARTVARNEAIVIHVTYNGLAKIAGIKPIPFKMVRLGEPDDYNLISKAGIYPYLESDYFKGKAKEGVELHLFNPDPEVVYKQIEEAGGILNYKGQLAYIPVGNSEGYYPIPSYFSAIKDIEAEGQLSIYDYNSIASGFNVAGMLSLLDTDQRKEDYSPLNDPNSVEYQISQFQGAENVSSIIINRVKTKEQMEASKFETFTGNDLSKRYESTTTRIEYRIARAMRVPNELAQIQRSGGAIFSDKELETASRALLHEVNPYQRQISEFFQTQIFPYWKEPINVTDFGIENVNYYQNGTVAQPG